MLLTSQEKEICDRAADCLKAMLQNHLFETVVSSFKDYLLDEDNFRYAACYKVIWYCAENMPYLTFYQAWHDLLLTPHSEVPETTSIGFTPLTQNLNFAEFPYLLTSAVANDPILNQNIHLVCIDVSQFIDPDNPAAEIYIEMLEQGCPERQGEPTTMLLLKTYWRLSLRNLEKRVALLFYNSKTDRQISSACLSALSTFSGAIALISDKPCENLERISPNHPDLIDAVLKWLRRLILEA